MSHCKFKYVGKIKLLFKKPTPDSPVEVDIKFPKNIQVSENNLIAGMLLYIGIWLVLLLLI